MCDNEKCDRKKMSHKCLSHFWEIVVQKNGDPTGRHLQLKVFLLFFRQIISSDQNGLSSSLLSMRLQNRVRIFPAHRLLHTPRQLHVALN